MAVVGNHRDLAIPIALGFNKPVNRGLVFKVVTGNLGIKIIAKHLFKSFEEFSRSVRLLPAYIASDWSAYTGGKDHQTFSKPFQKVPVNLRVIGGREIILPTQGGEPN